MQQFKKYSALTFAAVFLLAIVMVGCRKDGSQRSGGASNDPRVEQELSRMQEQGSVDVERAGGGQDGQPAQSNPLDRQGSAQPPAQPVRIDRIDQTTEVQIIDIDEAGADNLSDGLVTPRRPDRPASYGQQPVVLQPAVTPTDDNAVQPEQPPMKPVPVVTRNATPQPQQPAPQQPNDQARRAAQLSHDAAAFARRIESAHGVGSWRRKEAIQMDIAVQFGGNQILDAKFTFDPAVGRVRMDTRDGVVVIYNNGNFHIWPANAQLPRARFHVLTWPYFAAAQFKLRDPGTNLQSMGALTFNGQPHPAAKLTFGKGVGDSPDDWYIPYSDPKTNWLRGMAYIVTYGKDGNPAAAEPHAILYDDYVRIDGVILSRRWSFWNWTIEQGIHSEPRGSARVSNIRFVEVPDDWYIAPANARELAKP